MSFTVFVQSGNEYESEGKTRSKQRITERLTLTRVSGGDLRWRDDKDRENEGVGMMKREDKVRVVGKRREGDVRGRVIREWRWATLGLYRSQVELHPSAFCTSHF